MSEARLIQELNNFQQNGPYTVDKVIELTNICAAVTRSTGHPVVRVDSVLHKCAKHFTWEEFCRFFHPEALGITPELWNAGMGSFVVWKFLHTYSVWPHVEQRPMLFLELTVKWNNITIEMTGVEGNSLNLDGPYEVIASKPSTLKQAKAHLSNLAGCKASYVKTRIITKN